MLTAPWCIISHLKDLSTSSCVPLKVSDPTASSCRTEEHGWNSPGGDFNHNPNPHTQLWVCVRNHSSADGDEGTRHMVCCDILATWTVLYVVLKTHEPVWPPYNPHPSPVHAVSVEDGLSSMVSSICYLLKKLLNPTHPVRGSLTGRKNCFEHIEPLTWWRWLGLNHTELLSFGWTYLDGSMFSNCISIEWQQRQLKWAAHCQVALSAEILTNPVMMGGPDWIG